MKTSVSSGAGPSGMHEDLHRQISTAEPSDRSFGFVFAVVFAVLGCWPLLRHKPVRLWSVAAAAVFLLAGLVAPSILGPLNRVWMKLALLMSRVTNPIATGLLYYSVFTPSALVIRLLDKDLLRLRYNAGVDTYWIPRSPPGPRPESMRDQF